MPPRGRNYEKPGYKILLSLWCEKKNVFGGILRYKWVGNCNISSLIQQILDFQGISQKSHPSKWVNNIGAIFLKMSCCT